ncbi:aminotransferase class III-fold pyridoxal phosphate-dependent enzyme [Pontibacter qinzhouensis]|uniref:Aminotransferase class III-fold pyridoxal phosphate-dependent enzyme n=1 Tax=Pontibacter qinzhouensis TaxID=2603253 RepID=A0A5C8ILN2_9BACT|nr:aminotransferase class III-fold pyridoxal phosphate-dependent enzyme [Pontibacter qinzhouensis]TXK21969.1 aminotransferase class III-fold pyridoxal phosphate-dependent enzyme [Pontibacter qinzhouensis]
MNLFDVYPLFDIEPVKASGLKVWDKNGVEYLDLYGGHAVISIGHSHPAYIKRIQDQLHQIGFYSNAVKMPLQEELAEKLGQMSGYESYSLFLCNSGAEANENALKLASFQTGRKRVISFTNSFHGRTSAAVAATDNLSIIAPINETDNFLFLPFNNLASVQEAFAKEAFAAVIIEGIQGIGGVYIPDTGFLEAVASLCKENGALLILDEVQSGYGRSGKFFAHQYANVSPDIITTAKGMGNGYPIGGVLIAPHIQAKHGMLGTTFGGNYLACAAGLAVLEVMEQEDLMNNAIAIGNYLMEELQKLEGVKEVRGQGLMIGVELPEPCGPVRSKLLHEHKIFTGSANNKNTLRLLPALSVTKADADQFLEAFRNLLS